MSSDAGPRMHQLAGSTQEQNSYLPSRCLVPPQPLASRVVTVMEYSAGHYFNRRLAGYISLSSPATENRKPFFKTGHGSLQYGFLQIRLD